MRDYVNKYYTEIREAVEDGPCVGCERARALTEHEETIAEKDGVDVAFKC